MQKAVDDSLICEFTKSLSVQPTILGGQVWIVVKVWRGLPVLAEVYDDRDEATRRSKILLDACNPFDDEVAVFETRVNAPQEDA